MWFPVCSKRPSLPSMLVRTESLLIIKMLRRFFFRSFLHSKYIICHGPYHKYVDCNICGLPDIVAGLLMQDGLSLNFSPVKGLYCEFLIVLLFLNWWEFTGSQAVWCFFAKSMSYICKNRSSCQKWTCFFSKICGVDYCFLQYCTTFKLKRFSF